MTKLTLVTILLTAALSTAGAASNESLESLKARADGAELKKQPELFTKVAQFQLQEFAKASEEGNPEQAEEALQDILEYGIKAAQSSQETGKRMKQTEIAIRKISSRLEDIGRTLSFDKRQPVESAIEKLESARTDLLHHMFRKR